MKWRRLDWGGRKVLRKSKAVFGLVKCEVPIRYPKVNIKKADVKSLSKERLRMEIQI